MLCLSFIFSLWKLWYGLYPITQVQLPLIVVYPNYRYSVINCCLSYFSVYVTNRDKCNKINMYTLLVSLVKKQQYYYKQRKPINGQNQKPAAYILTTFSLRFILMFLSHHLLCILCAH